MILKQRISAGLLIFALPLVFFSCGNINPEPVKLNVDACQHCKMNIADLKFATELITGKGRIYKFDDLKCMVDYVKENNIENSRSFVADYNSPAEWIAVKDAHYVSGGEISSPMNGNVAAFSKKEEADSFASQKAAALTTWEEVNK